MDFDLKIGDLVWAKMKTFSPWPARIVEPGPNTPTKTGRKEMQWVYFFGTKNYAWIENTNIKPYAEFKEKNISSNKASNTGPFKKAISEIEEFRAKLLEDPNYELPLPVTRTPSKEKNDPDKKFNKLISPKKSTKKSPNTLKVSKSIFNKKGTGTEAAPVKRQNSDASSTKNSTPSVKRSRGSPRFNENGISDVGTEILNRPSILDAPDSPAVDLNTFSELLKTKDILASDLTFGFIGLGTIGMGIVKNLINSGHKVNLYNRTLKKCEDFKTQADSDTNKVGLVNTYITPCDVMQNSDIVFNCVSDPYNAKENVVGNCGITKVGDHLEGKGYVEMTSIDPQTSKDMCEIIKSKGGRYLEAQVQGSKNEADEGSLVVLAAGDKSLFVDCQSCFKAMGKTAFFLGNVGYATKTNLILQLMKGVALVGLAEGLALADRCGISSKDVLNIFNLTNLACGYLSNKADLIVKREFKHVEQAIKHMQKDMQLALDLSDQLKQPLLMTSTANEVYKHARRLGYDDHDSSCVYMRTRH
ncbi:cytokine-like nuclear factor N-PAC isoform X1 [Diorhabda sublineata]|uniref:cytokine-like nuclear factor N-PAC isoform X1 n=1 Tax=Diorhabda sublineata TaxID=1163346 RepID=UPI0024E0BDB8|nr:cytokine-like nuclear factor N-PAC isoform X1 [Diorhabda sublineata]